MSSAWERTDLDARLRIARAGNVLISVWSDALSVETVPTLAAVMGALLSPSHARFAWLSVLDGVSALPSAEVQGSLLKLPDAFGKRLLACATTLYGTESRRAECVLNSSAFLARPPFPVRFFGEIAPAATWLTENGAVLAGGLRPVDQLVVAAELCARDADAAGFDAAKRNARAYELLPTLACSREHRGE